MPRTFAISFDYRCPFARNAHESVVRGLREGRDWDVQFVPFSLDQSHIEEGSAPVWDRELGARGGGVLALEWGLALREAFPEKFLDGHLALFAARHDHAQKLADEAVLREAVASVGLDPDEVATEVATGRPLKTLAAEHTDAVKTHGMFGVPTFVIEDRAVFIRLMDRNSSVDIDAVLGLFDFASLNEFKHTRVPR